MFGSDNMSPVLPEILEFLSNEVNQRHLASYGADPFTEKAKGLIRSHFQVDGDVVFVGTGTAANVLALDCLIDSNSCIYTALESHLLNHEAGAPQRHLGVKLQALPSKAGKIQIEDLRKEVQQERYWGRHSTVPQVVSITQPTELGALYSIEEVKEIASFCAEEGLLLHMDGCRIYNAAVALGKSLSEVTFDLGIDALSLGGTKNGLMGVEAVVFRKRGVDNLEYRHKQLLQLQSKMRYFSSQFIPYLGDGLWKSAATKANDSAKALASRLQDELEAQLLYPRQTNQLFVGLKPIHVQKLREVCDFFAMDVSESSFRFVTSFDHSVERITQLKFR